MSQVLENMTAVLAAAGATLNNGNVFCRQFT